MIQTSQPSNPWTAHAQAKKDQALENMAEALRRIAEQHAEHYVNVRPELMRDTEIRSEYFGGISRSHYWALTKRPDFPKAIILSPKIKLRRRSEIEAWLSAQPIAA